jgi:hypothetical protein
MCTCNNGCAAEVRLTAGDDYLAADNMALCFTQSIGESWPSAVVSITLTMQGIECGTDFEVVGTYTGSTPAKACFDIPKSQTIALNKGKFAYNYTLRGVLSTGGTHTFSRGMITVL